MRAALLLFLALLVAGSAQSGPLTTTGASSLSPSIGIYTRSGGGGTAPAIVGSCATGNFPNGSAGATATAVLGVVTTGDAIVVVAVARGITGVSPTISVSDGTGYTSDAQVAQADGSGAFPQIGIYHLFNVASGSHSVVATNTAGSGNSYGTIWACEVSGLVGALPVASTNSSAGSTTPTTGTATPGSTNTIAFSALAVHDISSTITFTHPPAGYTSIGTLLNGSVTAMGGSADLFIQTTTTTAQNASYAPYPSSNSWAAGIAIYH